MASVDDRVVSIKFDNESFQRKIAETISSLDKLKNSMDFSGARRGLEEMGTAGKNFNLSGVTSAVEGVSAKFLAMSTVAITALVNITSQAIQAGARIASAFTLKPLIEGFHEYETQLNSVQTILANTASKGTTMDEVNNALQKLNEYSDQTIYNFGEMARNIGTFTAAGVDLDTSVQSIKGIANLAAMSGSNSEQAATAMYQLSQAISAGSVKLMDWNSVVNAGMGGEAFKSALFETGKAMGTLTGVPVSQSFTEWEDAGNSFRESLEKGWITADVLTTTLAGFTGDLTKEMLLQKGFTDQQADNILKTAAIAKAAATEVKTFTQLVGTVKEAVGTGWADSFKIIVGNFEEAKGLWTMVNTTMGSIIKRSSDVRNMLLQAWKNEGGRGQLVESLIQAFDGLRSIITPIKEAFRDIFPPVTVQTLLGMSTAVLEFSKRIKIGGETADKLKSIFKGLFSIIEIGWNILKGLITVIKSFLSALSPAGSQLFTLAAAAGDFFTALNEGLVGSGALTKFFERLGEIVADAGTYIIELKDKIVDFFTFDIGTGPVATGMEEVSTKAEGLSGVTDALSATWDRFTQRLASVGDVLSKVGDFIKTFASELGSKLADAFGEADFNKGIDVLNVGILAAIGLVLQRMVKAIKNFDITGGFMEKVNGILDETRKTLKTFQLDIKAQALLKIAYAMAILTASIVVLSLIDSAALTKSLTAMAVGFGQLVAVMALIEKITGSMGPGDAAKILIVAGAMILLAIAMGILSMAIQNLSDLNMGELATGLIGVGVGLGILVQSSKAIAKDKTELAEAGGALISISLGLLILSIAVAAFSHMSWEEMSRGLIGVAIGLGLMTVALRNMPKNMSFMQKSGFAVVAFGLKILADAVQLFGNMDWQVMTRGLGAVAASLAIVAGTMHLMPEDMQQKSMAILVLSGALYILALAMKQMGSLDLGELAKGIVGFLVVLLILTAAMEAMEGGAAGAGALVLVAGAMFVLAQVLKTIGEMDIMTLIQGLVGLAAVLAVLGIAAVIMEPVLPALLALGIALSAVGIGIALFGLGAMLLAKSFEIMANSGVAGAKAILEAIDILLGAIPKLAAGLAMLFVQTGVEMLASLPKIIEVVGKLLTAILDLIIEQTPRIAEALVGIIRAGFMLIRESFGEYVRTGIDLLMSLLKGIRDNIGEVVTTVAEIITSFIDALTEKIPEVAESIVNFVITLATEVAYRVGEMQTAFIPIGKAMIDGFLSGLNENLGGLLTWFLELPFKLIDLIKQGFGISSPATSFIQIGIDIMTGLLNGLVSMIGAIWDFFSSLPGKVLGWVGDTVGLLFSKGWDLILGLLQGLGQKERELISWAMGLAGNVIGWIGETVSKLWSKGWDFISGLINGLKDGAIGLITWVGEIPGKIIGAIPNPLKVLFEVGSQILHGIWDGMLDAKQWLEDKAKEVVGWVTNPIGSALDAIGCPSRLMMKYGRNIVDGIVVGMDDNQNKVERASTSLIGQVTDTFEGNNIIDAIAGTMGQIPDILAGMDEFNPVITPVLDLTKVEAESAKLQQYMRFAPLTPDISFDKARIVSATIPEREPVTTPPYTGPTEVTFEQNIYSPTQLSTNDIYRNTKSQIALAKEELGIK